ncbi:MAG: tetratricopeptide repeat protein [Planctomycetes bacterium]|nr:tetratricopeptide repeat protein [Planctomycetota bacterium]
MLEQVYDPIKKEHPDFVEAYVASGDLALEKQDFGVAAQEFERAAKIAPDDPDILYRLARAWAEGDAARSEENLRRAVERNPSHADSLLHLVDAAIDRESFDEAEGLIDRVLRIQPRRPEAHAYRAVLAHLRGDYAAEAKHRAAALAGWSPLPVVDSLIGRKLSQNYRFAEGAAYQRRALEIDPDHLPAKMQLCQDLLRLGRDEEGWRLVAEVYEIDGYSVVAHNLNVLKDHLAAFRTLSADGLLVRMDPREADIYGKRVLDLLARARTALCARYDVRIDAPVAVEIYPEQKDFAIRTFGLPGGAGFLGVCFGGVITANSPASQGESPSNWEAVLWHEFCHAVTLHKTRNRMPRWLSEGISVHEEKLADGSWGQSMTPQYLELIAESGITPVSRLSSSFLRPASPLHLQFAYYQSSLVVEFLVERHGLEALKHILSDLAGGASIDEALARRVGSLDELDGQAEEYIRARAAELASKADWSRPESIGSLTPEALAAWNTEHPRSFWGLQAEALRLVARKEWKAAKQPLETFLRLVPEYAGPENAYEMLALVHRSLGEKDAERAVLRRLAELSSGGVAPRLRLMDLCLEAKDSEGLAFAARSLLAVNPLIQAPHRGLAQALEDLGRSSEAIPCYRALLAMDPVDPSGLHFRLARALRSEGKLAEARRHVLASLEEAPRYRDAHRELLAIVREMEEPSTAAELEEPAPQEVRR